MKSSNPIFSVRGFGRDDSRADVTMRQPDPVAASTQQTDLSVNPYATATSGHPSPVEDEARANHGMMTIDDVVVRTATTLGTVAVAAVLSWVLLPVDEANIGRSYGIAVGAALVAFVLSLVQAFKRRPSPR